MKERKYTKLISIMLFATIFALLALTNDSVVDTTKASTSSLTTGFTGARGEVTCATSGCHTGVVQADKDEFTITVSPPDSGVYTVTVNSTSSDSSRKRWGFQMTALTAENAPVGTFKDATDGTTEIILNKGPNDDRQYIQNSAAGTFKNDSEARWTFQWTAPPGNSEVTFYAAGVQANKDGASVGDFTFTASLSLAITGETASNPRIDMVTLEGKNLLVAGTGFARGAVIILNGEDQTTKTRSEIMLIAKKAGKKISQGQTVTVVVRNPEGTNSDVFMFTRE